MSEDCISIEEEGELKRLEGYPAKTRIPLVCMVWFPPPSGVAPLFFHVNGRVGQPNLEIETRAIPETSGMFASSIRFAHYDVMGHI